MVLDADSGYTILGVSRNCDEHGWWPRKRQQLSYYDQLLWYLKLIDSRYLTVVFQSTLNKYFSKISWSLSGKSNETINTEIEMDPRTLPQLAKMELFATIANGFQLLTIVEETSICAVVSLFCSLSKVAGWFQLVT